MRRNRCLTIAMVTILAAVFFMASCAKQTTQAESPQPPAAQAENPQPAPMEPSPALDPPKPVAASAGADGPVFRDEKILFDFDSALLSGQARRILNGQADYLRSNANVSVSVEGHCDERGTTAYNMALGQRRAESVKKFLMDMGIASDRLNTISYGEERPVVLGSNESAWSQNRRVQLVIQ